jgi:hypothetical protein
MRRNQMKDELRLMALTLAIAVACVGHPRTLLAQAQQPPGPMTFSDLDQNGDGSLTETEFYTARANRMAERAKQGYPMRRAGKAPPFGDFDQDGNGVTIQLVPG